LLHRTNQNVDGLRFIEEQIIITPQQQKAGKPG
jgi:hypothetical protein